MGGFDRAFRRRPAKAGDIIGVAEAQKKAMEESVEQMLAELTQEMADKQIDVLRRFNDGFVKLADRRLRRQIARLRYAAHERELLMLRQIKITAAAAALGYGLAFMFALLWRLG